MLTFFAVSGFLVTKSWQAAPDLALFVRNRALRIMPALAVVVLLLALVIGPVLSAMPPAAYFGDHGVYAYLLNVVFVAGQRLPGVFADAAIADVNAPLWTLAFEAMCYALVAVLGAMRALTPATCAALMIALFGLSALHLQAAGEVGNFMFKLAYLGPSFFAGAIAALAADRVLLDGRLALLALAALILAGATNGLAPAFAIFGAYLVLYLAFAPLGWVRAAGRFGDFSYGLYLWGWPIQQIVQGAFAPENAYVHFSLAFPPAVLAAVLSWRFVEAPALAYKRARAAACLTISSCAGRAGGGARLAARTGRAAPQILHTRGE